MHLIDNGTQVASVPAPQPAVGTPGYAAPYGAPGIAVAPPASPMIQGQVYLDPGATYVAPGQQYSDQPIIIEGRRYYRDCWWDWGQRRCELKPWY